MSERDEYTPTMDEIVERASSSVYESQRRLRAEALRAIAAHDRALREQVAKEIEARRDHFIDRAATQYEWGLPAWANAYLNGLDDAIDVARGEEQTDE